MNAVEAPIQDSSVPILRDSRFPDLDDRGPRTPIRPLILEWELRDHHDKTFVEQLLSDIRHGCDIGFTGPQFAYTASNLQSAFSQPSILDNALVTECSLNRVLGPFDSPPLPNFRCSGLGLVPKQDGGWRTIYHLSAPLGKSINDFINPDTYTLTYCSVDDAFAIVNLLGPGTLLSKIDLQNAFRLIPVRQADWNLLGICWQGKYYIDTCLPFGLRSAPYIFNRLATAIHWILQNNYNVQFILHYLDDFLTAGREELQSFSTRKKCTKRQLLSLIGKLSFACKVVPAGRIFLRRLIDLSMTVKCPHHRIRISQEAQRDIICWQDFLPTWSGSSLILNTHWTISPSMNLYTDASGSEGWGAFWSGRWLQSHWSPAQLVKPILWKELFAIVNAINTWGQQWAKQKILFHCDNEAVVEIWCKGSTHDPETMALVRLLYFVQLAMILMLR